MTLTNEEQAAMDRARVIIESCDKGGYRAQSVSSLDESLARALISLHEKLEAAEGEQRKCFNDGQKAVDSARKERDRLRAELTEARNRVASFEIFCRDVCDATATNPEDVDTSGASLPVMQIKQWSLDSANLTETRNKLKIATKAIKENRQLMIDELPPDRELKWFEFPQKDARQIVANLEIALTLISSNSETKQSQQI